MTIWILQTDAVQPDGTVRTTLTHVFGGYSMGTNASLSEKFNFVHHLLERVVDIDLFITFLSFSRYIIYWKTKAMNYKHNKCLQTIMMFQMLIDVAYCINLLITGTILSEYRIITTESWF